MKRLAFLLLLGAPAFAHPRPLKVYVIRKSPFVARVAPSKPLLLRILESPMPFIFSPRRGLPQIGNPTPGAPPTVFIGGSGIGGPGTSDIGAATNSAYTAIPAVNCGTGGVCGGRIAYLCNGQVNSYNFSTPILLTTAFKEVSLTNACGSSAQVQLNYTPVTATTALTIDYTGSTGSAQAPIDVMDDLTLSNNGCFSPAGGCASLATGILFGNTAGANIGRISRSRIAGFGTGVSITTAQSWGMKFEQSTILTNTTGVSITANVEIETFDKVIFGGNGTAINNTGGGTIELIGSHIDQSTTVGLAGTLGTYLVTVSHFENASTPLTTHYANLTGSNLIIEGSDALDDATVGNTDYWFQSTSNAIVLNDVIISSAGRTATNILSALSPTQGFVRFINNSPATLTTLVGGANSSFISNLSFNGNSANAGPFTTFGPTTLGTSQGTQTLSRSATIDACYSLGRTAAETFACVPGNPGDIVGNSAAGDIWIRNNNAGAQEGFASSGVMTMATQVPFANLPASPNGSIIGCTNCLPGSNPCTGASTGAIAVRQNGAWVCK